MPAEPGQRRAPPLRVALRVLARPVRPDHGPAVGRHRPISALHKIGRTECRARSRRGSDRTRPGRAERAVPQAAALWPLVEARPAAAQRAGCRSSSKIDSGANSECRTWGTESPAVAARGGRTRNWGRRDEPRRRRPIGDCRNPCKTPGLPGFPRRSDRTSRADGTPLVRTSQEDFCWGPRAKVDHRGNQPTTERADCAPRT
jgi:hypothetical protein